MATKATGRHILGETRVCGGCGHTLVTVVDDLGHQHVLDVDQRTWVFSGRRDDADRAIVVQSRGYVVHEATCGGEHV